MRKIVIRFCKSIESFVMKSINVQGEFMLCRVEFSKIGKRDVTSQWEYLPKVLMSLPFDKLHCSKNRRLAGKLASQEQQGPYIKATGYPTQTAQNFWFFDHHIYIFWPLWRLLEAKHHTATAHFGTLTQGLVHPTVPVLFTKGNKK